MKTNKKMKIEDLKVQSFITAVASKDAQAVLGGQTGNNVCPPSTGCDDARCGIIGTRNVYCVVH